MNWLDSDEDEISSTKLADALIRHCKADGVVNHDIIDSLGIQLMDIEIQSFGFIQNAINANIEHMVNGTDYFKVCADEIRTNKIMKISNKVHEDITLITESGYLMLHIYI